MLGGVSAGGKFLPTRSSSVKGILHSMLAVYRTLAGVATHGPLSSSFLWFILRILSGNPQKELLRGRPMGSVVPCTDATWDGI